MNPAPADPTLEPTFYLDSRHPEVLRFAEDAVRGAHTERERAVRLFLAVREGIRYDPYAVPQSRDRYRASEILKMPGTFCVPKAIVLAAAARAIGIPSRLGFADVANHLATKRLLQFLRTDVFAFHGYVAMKIDGAWRKATPAFNSSLCRWFGVEPIAFDGEHDAVLQPFNTRGDKFMEYSRDHGLFDDFPADKMLEVWKQTYPHFFDGDTPLVPDGDFLAEYVEEMTDE